MSGIRRLAQELFTGLAPEEPEGVAFGRFTLVRELGSGGMASVHLAWDRELRRYVALKLLHAGSEQRLAARFRCEAQAAARVRHPHLVTVHEAGEVDGRPYLVMELVEGHPLNLRGPRDEALNALRKVALALHEAHRNGVVHRDLKPHNILMDARGEPRVVDFGLAHLSDSPIQLTRTGSTMGTPQYMAPEQVAGREELIGPRTDVYALGVMLYEAIAGIPAHDGRTEAEVYQKILHGDVKPPAGPRDLVMVCLKAMAKEPERRYASAGEFAEDVRRWLDGEPVLARPPSIGYRARKFLARRRVAVAAIAAVAVTLAIAIPAWLRVRADAQSRARAERDREESLNLLESARGALEKADLYLYRKDADYRNLVAMADPAQALIERAISKTPGLASAHYVLGRAWELKGDWNRAEACLRRAVAIDPRLAPARYHLGRLLLVRAFLANLTFAGQSDEAQSKEAQRFAAEAQGEIAAAIENGGGLDSDVDRTLAAAMLAHAEGNASRAQELIQAGLDRSGGAAPGTEALHWFMGVASGQPVAPFDRAIDIAPNHVLARYCRGVLRVHLVHTRGHAYARGQGKGELERAIEDLTRAIAFCPAFAEAHCSRGFACFLQGELDRAIEDYTRAVELSPRFAAAYYERAIARNSKRDVGGALADLDEAIKTNPALTEAYFKRGLYRKETDRRGARADFKRFLELAPAGAEWSSWRATAEKELAALRRTIEEE